MRDTGEYLFTSESVSEGHPDKVADRLSDTVLDAFLTADPYARVACETLVTTNRVVLAGETGELRVTLVLAEVTVSSNKAVPPLAKICETPLTFQSFAVVMSQLPSVKPLQTNASEVMFS